MLKSTRVPETVPLADDLVTARADAMIYQPATTVEDWLDSRYGRRFVIVEFPTVDGRGVPRDVLEGAANQVLNWLEAERTVIVIDSAGAERTARVCEAAGCRPIPER